MTGSEKYGTDESTIPSYVDKYIFNPNTANANLRKHLYKIHALGTEVHAPQMEEPGE